MILGDNPSCTSFPPVTLDWTYDVEASMSCTVERMGKAVGIAPGARRTEWVLDAGFTPTQVHEQSETCTRIIGAVEGRVLIEKSSLQEKSCDVVEFVKRRAGNAPTDVPRGSW